MFEHLGGCNVRAAAADRGAVSGCWCAPCDFSTTTWLQNNDRSAPTQRSRAGDQRGTGAARRTPPDTARRWKSTDREEEWRDKPPERLHAQRWLSPAFSTAQKCQILTDYPPSGNINYKTAPWAPLGLIKIHWPQLKPGWKNVLLCSEKQQLNILAAVYQKENP